MTPQERLDKIEGLLERQSLDIDKQNAGIRDLIIVSRAVLTSIQQVGERFQEIGNRFQEMDDRHAKDHQRFMADMDKLSELHADTEEKLNILINTVDRIIRDRNRNN